MSTDADSAAALVPTAVVMFNELVELLLALLLVLAANAGCWGDGVRIVIDVSGGVPPLVAAAACSCAFADGVS